MTIGQPRLIARGYKASDTLSPPTKIYFKNGMAKMELGLAKGKKTQDKREDIKRKEAKREMDKAIKRNSRFEY